MRQSRFTEAQIIGMIKEQEAGMPTAEVCRRHGLMKWSHILGQVCGLAKLHLVCVRAAFRVSAWPKYPMSGVRLSRAV
jgi:hypothetical protein